jgi:hypothetical protein
MEPIELHTILSGIIILILFFAGLFCIAYGFVKWQRRRNLQEDEYERVYKWTQNVINDWQANEQSYDYIMKLFERLNHLKFKNKEKTKILFVEFLMKYKSEAKKRV